MDITSDVLFDIAYDVFLFDICSELLLHFNEANFNLKVYKSFYWSFEKFKAWTTDDARMALYLP